MTPGGPGKAPPASSPAGRESCSPPPQQPEAGPPAQGARSDIATVDAVCHRAKNDLQTICHLLAMAQPFADTPGRLAEAVEARVAALATCYSLHHGGQTPDLRHLAEAVVARLREKHRARGDFSLHLPALPLGMGQCSPLALWLNEVVDNALSHGRAAEPGGGLEVSGGLWQDGLRLAVSDNGPGLPAGFDPWHDGRLGLRLAAALAQHDLGGSLHLAPKQPGLTVELQAAVPPAWGALPGASGSNQPR